MNYKVNHETKFSMCARGGERKEAEKNENAPIMRTSASYGAGEVTRS